MEHRATTGIVWHPLTFNLLTTTIVAPPSNASKWQMGFNSAFKGLNAVSDRLQCPILDEQTADIYDPNKGRQKIRNSSNNSKVQLLAEL
jgi:predicted amidophosphoribosyltransferase